MRAKKIGTSKKILVVNILIAVLLAIAVTVGAFLGKDMSQVAAIAVGWDAQLAVSVGFYYWKAKNENRSIHAMKLVKDLAKEYGIEHAVHLAEVVLKD